MIELDFGEVIRLLLGLFLLLTAFTDFTYRSYTTKKGYVSAYHGKFYRDSQPEEYAKMILFRKILDLVCIIVGVIIIVITFLL